MAQDEITIRPATESDVPAIVHHRRAMFMDIGMDDEAALSAVEASFEPYLHRAMRDGEYRGWLAETSDGQVVAGGGLLVYEWPSHPRHVQ